MSELIKALESHPAPRFIWEKKEFHIPEHALDSFLCSFYGFCAARALNGSARLDAAPEPHLHSRRGPFRKSAAATRVECTFVFENRIKTNARMVRVSLNQLILNTRAAAACELKKEMLSSLPSINLTQAKLQFSIRINILWRKYLICSDNEVYWTKNS